MINLKDHSVVGDGVFRDLDPVGAASHTERVGWDCVNIPSGTYRLTRKLSLDSGP